MNHIAANIEHVVIKSDPPQLADLIWGQNLGTAYEIEVYADRQQAIDAIKAIDPDFEPPEWVPIEIPSVVSMRQGRLALLQAGHLSQVSAAIAAIPDPMQRQAAEIEWEYAATIDRNSQLTQAIQHQIGITDSEMDKLFYIAAGL
jgi:hypothetical protein